MRSNRICWQTSEKVRVAGQKHVYLLLLTSSGIIECQIVSWSVKPGDKVEQFDPICEVSSDKATVEVCRSHPFSMLKVLTDNFLPDNITI